MPIEFNFDRAIADCTEAIRLNSKDSSAYARRGAACRMKGDYDRAIADCTEAIRLNPSEFSAFADRGVAYRMKSDCNRAISDCTEAWRLKSLPGWEKDERWWSGKDWWEWDDAKKKKYGPMTLKEITILIQAKKITATTTVWTNGMGKTWAKADTMPELQAAFNPQCEQSRAIAEFTEAIRLNPNDSRAFAERGDIYRKKGDYDRAITDLTEAIRLDSTYSWAFAVRGAANRAKGIRDNENAAMRHWGTGKSEASFLKTDDFDLAIADFTEAIRLAPTNSPWPPYMSKAFAARGKTNRRMCNYDRAIADCTEAIRLDAKNAEAFAVRGDARWAKDEYDLATADLTEAVRLDPKKDHKDLLDKVNRSLRNAAAKIKPSPRQETKPASTPMAKTPVPKPSKTTPVQPPQQAHQGTGTGGSPMAQQAAQAACQSIDREALMDKFEELLKLEVTLSQTPNPSENVLKQRETFLTEATAVLSRLSGTTGQSGDEKALYQKYYELLMQRFGILAGAKNEAANAERSRGYQQVPCPTCNQTGYWKMGWFGEELMMCRHCGGKGWLLD